MASAGDDKNQDSRLFGVDLAEHCSNFDYNDHAVNAFLGGETRTNRKGNNEVLELVGSVSKRGSSAHESEARVFHKKREIRLFGLNLTQHSGHFGQDDHALKASLRAETLARKKRNNEMPEIEGSISKKGNKEMTAIEGSTQGSKTCVFPFYDSDALGGIQNVVKNERTPMRSNPILNTLPITDCFQYRVVRQQPSHVMFRSSSKLSHNFEFQRVELSNNRPHLKQRPRNFKDVKFSSISVSSLKRARNDNELLSSSLRSVERIRNEDAQQHNTMPGRMVTLSTKDVQLDLSLHL